MKIETTIELPAARSQRAASGVAKGKLGEREALVEIVRTMQQVEQALGLYDAQSQSHKVQRNLQQSISGGCDLVGIPALSVEVKRQETLKLDEWWRQTVNQAVDNLMPVLLYRPSRTAWRVRCYTMISCPPYAAIRWVVSDLALSDFLAFYADVYANWLLTAR